MKIFKTLKSIVSILLVITLAVLTPLNVSATAAPRYVSDVTVCLASDFEEAKEELKTRGYEIVANGKLNAAEEPGIYLGYKTTDDPDKALTDIAGMNMLGDYSYGDYDELMEKYHGEVTSTVLGFETALAAFQTNFANGTPEAQLAYDSLNLFLDDDSGKLMGDYLLDYDFSEEAQKELTDTIMQANSDIVMSIMQTVSLAADTEETTMLDRLSKSDPDTQFDQFAGAFISVAKAQYAIEKEYGAAAKLLRAWWNDFYDYLRQTGERYFTKDKNGDYLPTEEALEEISSEPEDYDPGLTEEEQLFLEGIGDLTDTALFDKKVEAVSLFLLLDGMPYGKDGDTLLDFFMRPEDQVGTQELYSVAAAMSEAQRAQLEIIGLRATVLGAGVDLDENAAETAEAIESNAAEKSALEPISIFTDVDRSVFGDGVAVTGRAEYREQQTGENFLTKYTGISLTKKQIGAGIVYSTAAVLGTGAIGITAAVIQSRRQAPYAQNLQWAKTSLAKQKQTYDKAVEIGLIDPNRAPDISDELDVSMTYSSSDPEDLYHAAQQRYEDAADLYNSAGRSARIVKCVSFILFAIALIADICFIVSFFTSEKPAQADVPHHLVSVADTGYGEDYVYYETVKDQNGDPADVNHGKGEHGWLVLYKTREKSAGNPILAANLRVRTGNLVVEENGGYVHLFDRTGALNLTDAAYTGKTDPSNGTVVLFDRDANAYTGSAISGGIAALCAVGGAIVGSVGAILLGGLKKKKNTSAED